MKAGVPASVDGYSFTAFGRDWLANPERRAAGDPSRMSEIFASFENLYGPGFAQRANEAIHCHRTGNYLAACVMAGAAAESILLAVAIAKTGDEPKIFKEYASAGGRGRVTKLVITGLSGSVARTFDAALRFCIEADLGITRAEIERIRRAYVALFPVDPGARRAELEALKRELHLDTDPVPATKPTALEWKSFRSLSSAPRSNDRPHGANQIGAMVESAAIGQPLFVQ